MQSKHRVMEPLPREALVHSLDMQRYEHSQMMRREEEARKQPDTFPFRNMSKGETK